MEDKKSTKNVFDSLMREAGEYKWVVFLDDEETKFFVKDDIEEKLNSKGDFIKLEDFIVNKNSISAVISMEMYLNREDTDKLPTLLDKG